MKDTPRLITGLRDRVRLQKAALLLGSFSIGLFLASALGSSRSTPSVVKAPSAVAVSTLVPRAHVLGPNEPPPAFLASTAYASFQGLQAQLRAQGHLTIALEPASGGSPIVLGGDEPAPAGGTIAVPLLSSLLRQDAIRGAAVDMTERSLAARVIANPERASVSPLFTKLSAQTGGTMRALQALAGMLNTGIAVRSSQNGPTGADLERIEWSAGQSAGFFGLLVRGCLLSARDAQQVAELMNAVDRGEGWGMDSASFTKPVALADGWGQNSTGYFVRQDAFVNLDGTDIGVSMIARPTGGAKWLRTGESMLSSGSVWLRNNLLSGGAAPQVCSAS